MNTCHLCLKKKRLISSHVVPWCFCKHLIPDGDKHEPLILISKGRNERRSKGSYDKNILCADCDNFLGILDNYAYGMLKSATANSSQSKFFTIDNSDYKKFGLFVMSVIWRASISSRSEFKEINLGKYEGQVRDKILFFQKTGVTTTFGYFVIRNTDNRIPYEIMEKNIVLPFNYKLRSINVTEIVLPGGYKFVMKFDKRNFEPKIQKLIDHFMEQNRVSYIVNDKFGDSNEFKWMLKVID